MSHKATYTQLRDQSWGVRVIGTVAAGQAVVVTKKDGTLKTEIVARVLWSGHDSKTGTVVSLCSIGSSRRQGRGICVSCGEQCNPRYRKCLDCVDGGGNAHGGMSYYDRNGNFVLGDDD